MVYTYSIYLYIYAYSIYTQFSQNFITGFKIIADQCKSYNLYPTVK